jgi:hypothetical protein
MSPEAWADIFYTTFTTVRTAVLTPLIMLVVFVVLRLAGQRSLTEQTLLNRWAASPAAATDLARRSMLHALLRQYC